MKCCILEEPGVIRVEDVADPVAGSGDLVIRVEAALTCGTDLKTYRRGHPKMPCPTPFGHEFAGEIVETGAAVAGFTVGQAVMSANTGPCRACFYCERGQENLCESIMEEMILGAYAEYLRIPARVVRSNVFAKPPALPYEHAALLEPLSSVCFGLTHVAESSLHEHALALIIGAGPIALLWLVALKAAGWSRVMVAARRPQRAAVARSLGAAAVMAADDALLDEVRAVTEGRGADLVVECTGQPEVWQRAPALARKGGQAILFGGCPNGSRVELDTYRLHYDGVRIESPFHFRPRDVAEAYRLLQRDDIAWSSFITARATLDEVPDVFERLGSGTDVKCVVLPHAKA
jgi:L-iditol 2-dehydrogenase